MFASERLVSKSLGRRLEVYVGLVIELAQLMAESYFVASPNPEFSHRGSVFCTCVLGVLIYVVAVAYMRSLPAPIFSAINSEAELLAADVADRKHINRVRGMCCLSFGVIVLGAAWQMFLYLEALSAELVFPLLVLFWGLASITCSSGCDIAYRSIIVQEKIIDV